MEIEFIGDDPSNRFGHTITPIGKDRAILFGGAVANNGKNQSTQESTLSLETPTSASTTFFVGKNWKTQGINLPIGQPIVLLQLITFVMFLVAHRVEDN